MAKSPLDFLLVCCLLCNGSFCTSAGVASAGVASAGVSANGLFNAYAVAIAA